VARIFADGLRAALAELGHEASLCDDSDAVIAFAPDLVMVVDPACPKLTDHFTVGFVWESFASVERRTDWHGPIASWDLAVCTSPDVRQFLRDIQCPARDASAVSDLSVYPATSLEMPEVDPSLPTVAILRDTPLFETAGRDRELFTRIAERVPLHAYGPDESWSFLDPARVSPAPDSIAQATTVLARHRAVLAFGRQTPDATLFLAAGAGRLVVTNADNAAAAPFGPGVIHVDLDHDPREVADRIAASLNGMARPGARIPLGWSLIDRLPPLLEEIADLQRSRAAVRALGTVSVIIRCGGRPVEFLRRAVAAVAQQSYPDTGLLLVAYAQSASIEAYIAELEADPRWAFVRFLSVPAGSRSATLWAGLRAVDTPLFCVLDDDDEWFHDHLATLAAALDSYPQAMIAHSGTTRVEEWCFPPNPDTPAPRSEERRALLYLAPFDIESAMRLDHRIQSNAWLARSEALRGPILDDPRLNYGEDLYLFMMMAARHPYVFTGRASAIYNWRTGQADSSRAEPRETCVHYQMRMLQRLMRMPFQTALLGAAIYRRSMASEPESEATVRRPIQYESSLAEGIDFSRPGLPSFVSDISGLSDWERWGRWTTGPLLRITFRGPLPDAFCLQLRAHASEHNIGRRFTVRAGACTRQIAFPAQNQDVVLPFAGTGAPETLTIEIPNPRAPNASDPRPIGLGLVRLSVAPANRDLAAPTSKPLSRASGAANLVRSIGRSILSG
jgi:phosphoglycerol transferase